MLRILISSLFALLVAGFALGRQVHIEIPDWENAASFALVASQSAVRDGDHFEVAVLAEIEPGYHLYGPDEKPPSATIAEWTSPEAFVASAPVYPAPIRRDLSGLGEFDLYEGRVAIRIPVAATVGDDDSVATEVLLKYQLCTDNACSAPTNTTLTLELPVAPKGSSVEPAHQDIFGVSR